MFKWICKWCRGYRRLYWAIAAIRNDTDKHQYFYSSVPGQQVMIYCTEDTINDYIKNHDLSHYSDEIITKLHKATVNELIKFFNYNND